MSWVAMVRACHSREAATGLRHGSELEPSIFSPTYGSGFLRRQWVHKAAPTPQPGLPWQSTSLHSSGLLPSEPRACTQPAQCLPLLRLQASQTLANRHHKPGPRRAPPQPPPAAPRPRTAPGNHPRYFQPLSTLSWEGGAAPRQQGAPARRRGAAATSEGAWSRPAAEGPGPGVREAPRRRAHGRRWRRRRRWGPARGEEAVSGGRRWLLKPLVWCCRRRPGLELPPPPEPRPGDVMGGRYKISAARPRAAVRSGAAARRRAGRCGERPGHGGQRVPRGARRRRSRLGGERRSVVPPGDGHQAM